MGTTAQQRAQFQYMWMRANDAGDVEETTKLQSIMNDPRFSESSDPFAPHADRQPLEEGWQYDTSGLDDSELRMELSWGEQGERGDEKILRLKNKFGLEAGKDFIISPKGQLALTPSGQRKRGLEPDGSGRNKTIEGDSWFELNDFKEMIGFAPEAAGGAAGAVAGGSLGAAASLLGGPVAPIIAPWFIAGGAALGSAIGGMLGKGASEGLETLHGMQLQTGSEVATDIAIEGLISAGGEIAFPLARGLTNAARGTTKTGAAYARQGTAALMEDIDPKVSQAAISKTGVAIEKGGAPTLTAIGKGQPIFTIPARAENILRTLAGDPMNESNVKVVNKELKKFKQIYTKESIDELGEIHGEELAKDLRRDALDTIKNLKVKISDVEGIEVAALVESERLLIEAAGGETADKLLGKTLRKSLKANHQKSVVDAAKTDYGAAWMASKGQKVVPTSQLKGTWRALKEMYPDEVANNIAKSVANDTPFINSIDELGEFETVEHMHNLRVALRRTMDSSEQLKKVGDKFSAEFDSSFDIAFKDLPESMELVPATKKVTGEVDVGGSSRPVTETVPAVMADIGAEREAIRLMKVATENYKTNITPFKDSIVKQVRKDLTRGGVVDKEMAIFAAKKNNLKRILPAIPRDAQLDLRKLAGREWMQQQRNDVLAKTLDTEISQAGWKKIAAAYGKLGDDQDLFFPGQSLRLRDELRNLSHGNVADSFAVKNALANLDTFENLDAIKMITDKNLLPDELDVVLEDIAAHYSSAAGVREFRRLANGLGPDSELTKRLQAKLGESILNSMPVKGNTITGEVTFSAAGLHQHVAVLRRPQLKAALGEEAWETFESASDLIDSLFQHGPGGGIVTAVQAGKIAMPGSAENLLNSIVSLFHIKAGGKFIYHPKGRALLHRLAELNAGIGDEAQRGPILTKLNKLANKLLDEAEIKPPSVSAAIARQFGGRAVLDEMEAQLPPAGQPQ